MQTVGLFSRTLAPQAKYPRALGSGMHRSSRSPFTSVSRFPSLSLAEVVGDGDIFTAAVLSHLLCS